MNEALRKHRLFLLGALIFFGVALLSLGLHGCQFDQHTDLNEQHSQSAIRSPTSPFGEMQLVITDPSDADFSVELGEPVWEGFQPPSIKPATPIPPPLTGLALDDEVVVWVLLGTDTEPPFNGRTQAIHLLFFHPRLSKASLLSIPGDLYVYIPGYTMQRINIAYAMGGVETLRKTLTYNFGVTPSRFVLAHPGDFQWLVDDINGIDVTVFYPMPHACGGIRAGLVEMDGAMAICFASYRVGLDEVDRMRRQQQLLRVISRKFARDGNLVKLPLLFTSYQGWVKTDLSLAELMDYIPLALKLADPDRISYYMIGWDQFTLWEVPGYSQAQVFLPERDAVRKVLQQAIDDVMTPKPLTNQVQTLEAQLTLAHEATATFLAQITPTPTPTQTPTITETMDTTTTPTLPAYP